jgi:cadmium resistance protein CadD (predicted permease)
VNWSLLVAAFVAFAATSVDDLIVVTVLFTASRSTGRPRAWTIVAGQYIGFGAIIGASLSLAAGLRVIPDRWVGLLGFMPIAYGLWYLWRLRRDEQDSASVVASSVTSIALITLANGADNIAVFTPLFRSMHVGLVVVAVAGFVVLVGIWCAVGALLGTRRAVVATLGRIAHLLVPVVFIVVGLLILSTTGAFTLVGEAF